ncbi:MAG: thioredoxin family protein [Chitinophagaceae bacterium]
MKKNTIISYITLLVICCVYFSNAKAQGILPADSILSKSYNEAAAQNKNVLLIFHASWCGWCHKFDSSLNDKACKQFFNDNYIIVHLTVHESSGKKHLENPGGAELMSKYSSENDGIPFWVVFDKNGKWLADSKIRKPGESVGGANSGCPALVEEVSYFVSMLRKTSAMTNDQLKIIEKRFRQNE